MNKILKDITKEMINTNIDEFYKKVGNYEVYRDSKRNFYIKHYYYGNCICYVDLDKKQFSLYHCGYCPSTYATAQLNFLENFYKNKGYKLSYRGY